MVTLKHKGHRIAVRYSVCRQDMTPVACQLTAAASLTGSRQSSRAVVAFAGRRTSVRQTQLNQHIVVERFDD